MLLAHVLIKCLRPLQVSSYCDDSEAFAFAISSNTCCTLVELVRLEVMVIEVALGGERFLAADSTAVVRFLARV